MLPFHCHSCCCFKLSSIYWPPSLSVKCRELHSYYNQCWCDPRNFSFLIFFLPRIIFNILFYILNVILKILKIFYVLLILVFRRRSFFLVFTIFLKVTFFTFFRICLFNYTIFFLVFFYFYFSIFSKIYCCHFFTKSRFSNPSRNFLETSRYGWYFYHPTTRVVGWLVLRTNLPNAYYYSF